MALISRPAPVITEKLEIVISTKTGNDIREYMKFARLDGDISYFFEEAAKIVMAKDKEFKAKKSAKASA